MPAEAAADSPVSHAVLAIGGELKNTFCVGKGQLLYPSPYVGDMEDIRTVEALRASVRQIGAPETFPLVMTRQSVGRYRPNSFESSGEPGIECLSRAGSSGRLGPGAPVCIVE